MGIYRGESTFVFDDDESRLSRGVRIEPLPATTKDANLLADGETERN